MLDVYDSQGPTTRTAKNVTCIYDLLRFTEL